MYCYFPVVRPPTDCKRYIFLLLHQLHMRQYFAVPILCPDDGVCIAVTKAQSCRCLWLTTVWFSKYFKQRVNQGRYGAVFTDDFHSSNGRNCKNTLSRIFRELQHLNIVKFKGVCTTPLSLTLECAYFDFRRFKMKSKVSSLAGFLVTLNYFNCTEFDNPHLFAGECKDTVMLCNTFTIKMLCTGN